MQLGPYQTSSMGFLAKIVKVIKPLTIFFKKLHHRYLISSYIHLSLVILTRILFFCSLVERTLVLFLMMQI